MQQPLTLILYLRGKIGELAIVRERVAHLHQLRRGVDDLIGIDARHRAADDIAGIVAASAARGHADGGKHPENRRDVLDAQPVELDGLARGDVAEAVGEALGDFRKHLRLGGVQLPAGDLASAS